MDSDEENDKYYLDFQTVPSVNNHVYVASGVENLVQDFKSTMKARVRANPLQPFPSLYEDVRTLFSRNLKSDQRHLFLTEIPSFESLQHTLYQIRREFLPPAPFNQEEFNVNLDWFLIEGCNDLEESLEDEESEFANLESIVKGDLIHNDGLRVLLFATESSLQILARARTILGDGTFRICPSLW